MMFAAIAGAVLSAVGSIQSANAQAANADAQAQAANYNAKVAENNAMMTRQQASAREDAMRRQARVEAGKARAGIAQSGLAASGSMLDVYDQSALMTELDALNTRYEGEVQARGLIAQSQLDSYQAKVAKMNGKNAKTAGYINAASSLLSSASSYGRSYGMMGRG